MPNPFLKKIYEISPATFALDIGDPAVRVMKLEKSTSSKPLLMWGESGIPNGVIELGQILKEQELIKIIDNLLKSLKNKTKYVVASLPEQGSFIRVVRLPILKESEVLPALLSEIEEDIPLPIDEIYFGWQLLKTKTKTDHIDVLVAASPKALVDSYIRVLKALKLKIKALEIESFAVARSVVPDGKTAEPVLILDFGSRRTSFIIFANDAINFTSSVPISGFELTQNIAKELNISFEEAEKLKIQYGLDKSAQGGKIYKAQEPALNDLVKQIKDYIDFYHEHSEHAHDLKRKTISKIIICGGGANLLGLVSFLELKLRIPIELANPWINIFKKDGRQIPGISFAQSLSYAAVLGLAMLDKE